jgi:hypothetical protein
MGAAVSYAKDQMGLLQRPWPRTVKGFSRDFNWIEVADENPLESEEASEPGPRNDG